MSLLENRTLYSSSFFPSVSFSTSYAPDLLLNAERDQSDVADWQVATTRYSTLVSSVTELRGLSGPKAPPPSILHPVSILSTNATVIFPQLAFHHAAALPPEPSVAPHWPQTMGIQAWCHPLFQPSVFLSVPHHSENTAFLSSQLCARASFNLGASLFTGFSSPCSNPRTLRHISNATFSIMLSQQQRISPSPEVPSNVFIPILVLLTQLSGSGLGFLYGGGRLPWVHIYDLGPFFVPSCVKWG